MNDATIPTWSLLPSLGFQPDSTIRFSDILPGLSLDFGNFKLSASAIISPYSGEIVSFSGVLATPDTLANVHFEMPRRVESLRQCAAWIVWSLDRYSNGAFKPARPVGWVEEARANRKLLPWYRSLAEYEARPCCLVERKWLRLALNTLAQHVTSLHDDAAVVFGFDGSVLSIRCEETHRCRGAGTALDNTLQGRGQCSATPAQTAPGRARWALNLAISPQSRKLALRGQP